MSERLAADPNLRGYKLLHENPRHHDPRTYNRPTSDEVAVAWEGDCDNPTGVPEARDLLIEAHSGDRFSVPYWHPAYMPLRYPLIFLRGSHLGIVTFRMLASLWVGVSLPTDARLASLWPHE